MQISYRKSEMRSYISKTPLCWKLCSHVKFQGCFAEDICMSGTEPVGQTVLLNSFALRFHAETVCAEQLPADENYRKKSFSLR